MNNHRLVLSKKDRVLDLKKHRLTSWNRVKHSNLKAILNSIAKRRESVSKIAHCLTSVSG